MFVFMVAATPRTSTSLHPRSLPAALPFSPRQAMEQEDVVDPVQELRPERASHHRHDGIAHGLDLLALRLVGEDFRAEIRRHDDQHVAERSEEHTSELQSLMRISYDVFTLNKKPLNITHSPYRKYIT